MDSMEKQYGFDANFVDEVPEYLKCVVCHLVLRQPIQIMKCGHRFCDPCFGRIKKYSLNSNTELCCPIDRDAIDLKEVFKDTGMARVVNNLKVKCTNVELGCTWIGDLRDLQTHEQNCEHGVKDLHYQLFPQGLECDFTANSLKELRTRMSKCEDAIVGKEKDMAHLKYNLHELKKNFNEKEEEVDLLKVKNMETEKEVKLMKERNQELKKNYEREMENLSLKSQLLENKIESLGNQLVEITKLFDGKQEEMISIISEWEESKNNKGNLQLNATIDNEVRKLKEEVMKSNNEIKSNRMHLDNSLHLTSNEINKLVVQVTGSEKTMEDKFNTLNDEVRNGSEDMKLMKNRHKEIDTTMVDIDDLKDHVTNIENILFCDGSKGIVLQWKLQNYQYLFELGKTVFSPTFYTQINGYCFQLFAKWEGDKKERFGLYLKLCRGSKNNVDLEAFRMEYVLTIRDSKEIKLVKTIKLEEINRDANREKYFTIYPDRNTVDGGYGATCETKDWIVKDMLSIKCILTPC